VPHIALGGCPEPEGPHHVAPIIRDPLGTPRRHPHPVDAERLHDAVERLGCLLFEHVGQRAPRRREGHRNDQSVVLVVPSQIVDQAEVDDIDPEFGIHDILQRLLDLVEELRADRGGHDLSLRPSP
jgi:hypothetical protein